MRNRIVPLFLSFFFLASGAALVAGCGGGGNADTVVEAGTTAKSTIVLGKLTNPVKAAMMPMAAGDPITVYVLSDPNITATVGTDGTFTLRGLPAGSFTLVFKQGDDEVGRLVFAEVAANQQITISVQLVDSEVVLVDEDRRGIGNAGVEIEALVDNVVVLNAAGDSRFVIGARSVVARPGVTAIREGNTRKTVEDVTVGRRVHVKGTTVADSTDVLAFEIKLQGPDTGTGTGGAEKQMTICHIPPGNPAKAKTLTVGSSAWPAHQAHGDTEGACKP
jgi:hypothetical protein